MISIRGLVKQYHPPRGPLALAGIDLEIAPGEIFGLLGPNGAGKTTLIGILCGLLAPTQGDALVAGHSIVRDATAARPLIGVVPEEIALYPQLSGRQNLRYFGRLYGLGGPVLERAIDDVLAAIGLAERADERVARYSSGMKRRLNVAVGVLHRPRVVLLDEPTLGLDPQSRRRILELVRRLRDEAGATILYSTHHMEEAQELSDRVGIIHRGRIIALGAPAELIRAHGAGDILRLQVGDAAVAAEALAAWERIPGVSQALMGDGVVTLCLPRATESLPAILRIAEGAGVRVDSLSVQQANLEAVFLHLTGERLTEERP